MKLPEYLKGGQNFSAASLWWPKIADAEFSDFFLKVTEVWHCTTIIVFQFKEQASPLKKPFNDLAKTIKSPNLWQKCLRKILTTSFAKERYLQYPLSYFVKQTFQELKIWDCTFLSLSNSLSTAISICSSKKVLHGSG